MSLNIFNKSRMVAEVTAPDQKKVIRQLEYYFGDSNLQRDKFLQDEIKKDPEGWISLETMLKVSKAHQWPTTNIILMY